MTNVRPILVVEDSDNDLELMLEGLREHKLANPVDVARNGEEALDYLFRRGRYQARSTEDPAVVLLDLKMPKVDGLEVLQALKAHPHLKRLPVVMLTSSREEQDVVRSYQLGVNAYVVKPVSFHEFMEAVRDLGAFWAVVNSPPPPIGATA